MGLSYYNRKFTGPRGGVKMINKNTGIEIQSWEEPFTFDDYQFTAQQTKIYSKNLDRVYPALGLGGETGEVLEIVKKLYRDGTGELTPEIRKALVKEMGDVVWYLAMLALDFGISFQEIARENLIKLFSRKERNKLHGSGSDR